MRPSVSAVIPIRNGAYFFKSIKQELLKTLNSDDQIIIVDDDSTDNTFMLFKEWQSDDSRVSVIKNKKVGLSNALNLGFKFSDHEWIARYDQDDLYHKDRINLQFKSRTDSTVAIFSDFSFRSQKGKYLGRQVSPIFPECVSLSLISNRRTPHPVALINKNAALSVGGYNQEHFPVEDLSLWLRLSKCGDLISVPETLLNYTINRSGVTQNNRNRQIAMRKMLLNEIGIPKKSIEFVNDNLAKILESYDSFSNSSARSYMLLSELKKTRRYLFLNQRQKKETVGISQFYKVKKILPDFNFLFFVVIRKLYRKIPN
jgi:glycosyltransferase involved in cell wall biosynthesis